MAGEETSTGIHVFGSAEILEVGFLAYFIQDGVIKDVCGDV